MAVLDTMAFSAVFHESRRPDVASPYRATIEGRAIVLSFASVTELRYGALKGGWGDLRLRALERDLASLVVVQPDERLMGMCAELRDRCERAGHPLGQKIHEADRWIATTALRLDVPLVSTDRVFQEVRGLKVLNPHPES